MKIDLDRLCHLAGVKPGKSSSVLREGAYSSDSKEETMAIDEMEMALQELEEEDGVDEMIEIDEVMLVQELRRAKRIMQESKKKKETLVENELKSIVESEIQNVLRDLNLTDGSWVYGSKKPTRSKQGYSHQGSYLKGLGFK